MTARWCRSYLVAALALGHGALAHAQPSATDAGLADSLFREARRLHDAGQHAEACPKFAESHRLQPAGGTLLNLAACHEAEGRLATAWAEFQEALVWARREGRAERETVAEQRLAALEPRLSRISVVVPDAARAPGLEISLDGTVLTEVAWGVPAPVDPGAHVVRVQAPGKQPRDVAISIDAEGQLETVTIGPLSDVQPEPAPAPPAEPPHQPPPRPAPRAASPIAPPPDSEPPVTRTLAYVIGGAGLVSLGIGTYFGIRAIDRMEQSDQECAGGSCTPRGAALSRDANDSANIANLGAGLGLVGIGTAVVLLLTADQPPQPDPTAVRVRPDLGPGLASLTVGGSF